MFDDLEDEEELEFITERDIGDDDELSDDIDPKKSQHAGVGTVATVGEVSFKSSDTALWFFCLWFCSHQMTK